jgi:hypothetical protein
LHGPELAALSGSILFPQSASGAFTSIRLDSTYFALFRLREIRLRFGGVNTTSASRRRVDSTCFALFRLVVIRLRFGGVDAPDARSHSQGSFKQRFDDRDPPKSDISKSLSLWTRFALGGSVDASF